MVSSSRLNDRVPHSSFDSHKGPVRPDHGPSIADHDFSKIAVFPSGDVRVHRDSPLAAAMHATAFTEGNDIHVAPGQPSLDLTFDGEDILAHELTHVAQQRAGRVPSRSSGNGMHVNDDPALEQEAESAGRSGARIAHGITAGWMPASRAHEFSAGAVVQRIPSSAPATSPWWPPIAKKRVVVIKGYDFDFLPSGEVDGPIKHNGTFTIVTNDAKSLKMKIQVGTDDGHTNDLDVVLAITGGQATITGSIEGKKLEAAVSVPDRTEIGRAHV